MKQASGKIDDNNTSVGFLPGRVSHDVEKASLAASHPWLEGKERKLGFKTMYPLIQSNNNTA